MNKIYPYDSAYTKIYFLKNSPNGVRVREYLADQDLIAISIPDLHKLIRSTLSKNAGNRFKLYSLPPKTNSDSMDFLILGLAKCFP